ncbi:FkbM family methyltransferase [Cyanobium sp. ATX 6F1]|uniref:FkbM family methyltransferase n=1 Tax=unclassified Cyanobium TaxID=2627006 RepID=UPI0020CDCC54|nr:FkbM family methyltransferase [Cyanobium sp. ATX 6F1]MCP9915835.1 FkbM family methyltransferase [Cyanobium sp. ATX 6F1]
MNRFFTLVPHHWRQALKRRLFAVRDMTTRLQQLRRAGFRCSGAIDAVAYRGDWTREFWDVFPQVPVLMIEPQPEPQSQLRDLAASVAGSEVLAAALSDQAGSVIFHLQESNSGIRQGGSPDEGSITVPCATLAAILQDRPGFLPNLLKLDLQGHELQALHGAVDHLSPFEVIICELSVIPIGDVPTFAEVNRFFEENGYRLYDVLPQYDRPLDGALWQLDAFYVRQGSDLIASAAWD